MAFEGINFGLATPQTKLETPQEIQAKALQLQGLQQQTALGGINLKQQQQAMQDAADFKMVALQSNGDPKVIHSELLKMGKVELAQKVALGMMEMDKANATNYKAKHDALMAFGDQQKGVLRTARPENWSQVLNQLQQNANQFTQSTGIPINTAQNDHPQQYDPQWVKDQMEKITSGTDNMKQQELDLKKKELGNIVGGVHSDDKSLAFGTTRTGQAVPIIDPTTGKQMKLRAPASAVNVGLGGPGGLTPEAKDLMVEQFRKTGTLPSVGMGKAGTQLRMDIINGAAAKDKAEGTVTDLAEARKSFKTQQDAMKFFTTGKGADAMRQQETILHHAKVFENIANALDNGNVQIANQIGNQFGLQFGSDKATNLKMAGQIFSAEVGKYLAGSMGSAEERSELAKLLPMFNSPEQFKGGLRTLSNLVEGQRQSWMRQRTAALSGKVTDESGGAVGQRLSPEAASKLPPGTKFIGLDGKERTRN